MPPTSAAPSSSLVAPETADDELTLTELLDLFTPEDTDAVAPALPAWTEKWVRVLSSHLAPGGGPRRAW